MAASPPLTGTANWRRNDLAGVWSVRKGQVKRQEFVIAGLAAELALFKDTSLQLEGARQLDVPTGFNHDWMFNIAVRSLQ